MAEQEQREMGEEAEKRLKTQLIAKKESSVTASRVASPSLSNPAPTETTDNQQPHPNEADTSMEVDSALPMAKVPVSTHLYIFPLALHRLTVERWAGESMASRNGSIIRGLEDYRTLECM